MTSVSPRGAIIFAGGMEEEKISRQFSPDEEGTLLEYVLDSVWTVADELIVVFANEPKLSTVEAIAPFGAKLITLSRDQSPLTAILEAFRSSKAEFCLLATERVPLLKPNVTLSLFDNARGYDLAVPRWDDGKVEPLLAVYRKNALLKLVSTLKPSVEKEVKREMVRIIDQLFAVKYVSIEKDLKEIDPELDSFLEVYGEDSLSAAREKASIKVKKLQKKAY